MEIRVSLVLLAVLVVTGSALSASGPSALVDPVSVESQQLTQLEDAASAARGDLALTQRLAATYLRLGHPGLAITAVRAAPPEVGRDPVLTHRLAQAYEASGRVEDALGTAELALARCKCSPSEGQPCERVERCSAATIAAFEMHQDALMMLMRWGVTDPRHDTRTALAYRLAQRTARIASLAYRPTAAAE
jgi:predicted Zn-dependent protease